MIAGLPNAKDFTYTGYIAKLKQLAQERRKSLIPRLATNCLPGRQEDQNNNDNDEEAV